MGGVAACIDIGLFLVFAKYLGFAYLPVATCTFLLATLVNYALSVRFVFASGRRFRRRWEIALIYGVSAVGLALNLAILALCVEILRMDLLAAKLTATAIVFFWNYLARRYFVFGAIRADVNAAPGPSARQ